MDIKERLKQDVYRLLGIEYKAEEPKPNNKKIITKNKSPSNKHLRFNVAE
mgnify:CR=1 FL=1